MKSPLEAVLAEAQSLVALARAAQVVEHYLSKDQDVPENWRQQLTDAVYAYHFGDFWPDFAMEVESE